MKKNVQIILIHCFGQLIIILGNVLIGDGQLNIIGVLYLNIILNFYQIESLPKEFTNEEQLSYIYPDDSHKLHEFNIQSKEYKLIPDFAFNRYLWECELEFN